VFVTFFSPRQACPDRLAENHYRFFIQGGSVYASILGILELLEEEFDGREVTVHFGWPTSSWLDRMATGVFVAALMRLPRHYPRMRFAMEYEQPASERAPAAAAAADAWTL
jgi:hypothetical protein